MKVLLLKFFILVYIIYIKQSYVRNLLEESMDLLPYLF